jgi:hypothetical protein
VRRLEQEQRREPIVLLAILTQTFLDRAPKLPPQRQVAVRLGLAQPVERVEALARDPAPDIAEMMRMVQRLPRAMATALEETFGGVPECRGRSRQAILLPVSLPFEFGTAELERCSRDYGVIVCPTIHFSVTGDRGHQIRLSFSSVSPDAIADAVACLGRLVVDELGRREPRVSRCAASA